MLQARPTPAHLQPFFPRAVGLRRLPTAWSCQRRMPADGRLDLHLHAGALPLLLSSLVRREVAAVGGDPTLIFRGNSGVTKLLEAYCTMCAAPCRGVFWMSGWQTAIIEGAASQMPCHQ